MAWITLDVGLPKHPKLAELPNDSARFGWIAVLCESKAQRRPGTFASVRHFREVMGRFAKHLADYEAVGLLERDDDGTLRVHDWERHQWSVRQARHRERDDSVTAAGPQGDARVTDTDTDIDRDIYSKSASALLPRTPAVSDEPEGEAVTWLARHGCYVRPGSGWHQQLVVAVEHHGINAIVGMFDRLAAAGMAQGDTKGYVFGAIDALNARTRPDAAALGREDAKAENGAKVKAANERLLAESRHLVEDAAMPPEQAAANLARLHGLLKEKGLA